jgi:alpha-L-fucosidase
MAQTAEQIVALRNPTYGAKSDLSDMVDYAETQLSECTYGDQYANAVALLTMHYYAKQSGGDAPGSVTAETEGRLSRSFDSSKGTDRNNDWATTKWGQELIHLTDSVVVYFRNRTMGGC